MGIYDTVMPHNIGHWMVDKDQISVNGNYRVYTVLKVYNHYVLQNTNHCDNIITFTVTLFIFFYQQL